MEDLVFIVPRAVSFLLQEGVLAAWFLPIECIQSAHSSAVGAETSMVASYAEITESRVHWCVLW